MKPHARIGHRGAVHLERSLQSSRKREKRGHLPLLRGIPARVEPDGMKRDDQHPADKRGAIIHVPVSVWFREGYGKLADWVCDGSGALLATACRTEVSNSDDTVRLNNQHSRGLTVGHAAHAVDFNRRPILSRQNVLALFRIPTASTNRAAELHEYQRSGFDDGEPFAVVQGYGKPSSWNRITERDNTTLIAASGSHVRASNGSLRIDDEHSRRLPVGDAHHRIDFDRRAQFSGQHVFALR